MQKLKFKDALNFGIDGEDVISNYFMYIGFSILPACRIECQPYKGPRLQSKESETTLPDLFAISKTGSMWIEAKHKSGFTWYRSMNRHGVFGSFQTGIDLKVYEEYRKIANETPFDVYLMFLHEGGKAKDSPESPAGLWGDTIENLKKIEDHTSLNYGRSGMVYWNMCDLPQWATMEELLDARCFKQQHSK